MSKRCDCGMSKRCDCGMSKRCDCGMSKRCDCGMSKRCECGMSKRCDCGMSKRCECANVVSFFVLFLLSVYTIYVITVVYENKDIWEKERILEKFDDTRKVIRSRNVKNRQQYCQQEQDKRTNNGSPKTNE